MVSFLGQRSSCMLVRIFKVNVTILAVNTWAHFWSSSTDEHQQKESHIIIGHQEHKTKWITALQNNTELSPCLLFQSPASIRLHVRQKQFPLKGIQIFLFCFFLCFLKQKILYDRVLCFLLLVFMKPLIWTTLSNCI